FSSATHSSCPSLPDALPISWSVLFRPSPVIVGRSPGVAGSVAAARRDACHASGLAPCAHICASLHRGGGSRAGTSVLRRGAATRTEDHTSELQSRENLECRL